MARAKTFARVFPKGHPRAGEPTYFVEKIWESIGSYWSDGTIPLLNECATNFIRFGKSGIDHDKGITWPKHHTIRAGHHFKPGDWFSPRVWGNDVNPKTGRSGPYHSKQITIAPDIQVKKVWDFMVNVSSQFDPTKSEIEVRLNNEVIYYESVGGLGGSDLINEIALNDGLSVDDFTAWFNYFYAQFDGQIICWNENINY